MLSVFRGVRGGREGAMGMREAELRGKGSGRAGLKIG